MCRASELGGSRISRRCGVALLWLGLCGISTSCSSSHPEEPTTTNWISFHEKLGERERYLMTWSDGSYESLVFTRKAQQGMLTVAQVERLKELTSEAQFDVYLEESAGCESVAASQAAQTVIWREQREGVEHHRQGFWIRMEVSNPETVTFLDTLSNLQLDLAE